MSRNILNEGPEVNVYLNRDPIEATLPVQAIQPTVTDPITISLKGLSGFTGQAGKVLKVNSTADALEYADDINTEYTAGNQLNLVGTQFNLDTDIQVDSLGVGTYFDVGYSNPYTAIFNGNNYSISNPYLRWHFNGTDLLFNIPAGSGSSSNFKWQIQNTTELMKLDGNGLLTVSGNIKADGGSTDNGQIEIEHGGGASEIGKLVFSNGTNVNTYSFEYSENTNNFSFKKNSAVLWDYDDSNSPAKFTVNPIFKFGNTVFHNSTNQQIILPTSAGKLALQTDITDALYWTVNSNDLKPTLTSYNVVLGKASPSSGAPKLDVLGDSKIEGNLWTTGQLRVEDHFAVEHLDPYTYIYDPTGFARTNPHFRYHKNGTDLLLNLPTDSGSSSSFRFFTANTTELMRLDANSTLKVFGTSSAKIEIENDGLTSSNSTLDFTNSANGDFYRFFYNYADDAFAFIHNGTSFNTVWEYNDATEEFLINKDTLIRNEYNDDAKLFIECSEATGAEAKLIFGDEYVTNKYTLQYDYHISTPAFELLDQNSTTIFRYTDNDNTFDFNNKRITTSSFISLTGIGSQITNGSDFYNLPSASGTLALESQLPNNVFNTSGTTMTADPQANDSVVCTEFKISAGPQANGDCTLIIEADTDNTTLETANPIIKLVQDGGNVQGRLELTSDNHLQLTNPDSKVAIHSFDDIEIYAGSTPDEGIRIDSTTRNLEVDNNIEILNSSASYIYFGINGDQSDCYLFGNSVNDFVFKIGTSSQGGDMKLFRNNTPSSSGAGNWEGDLFINATTGVLGLYGGYSLSGYSGERIDIGNNTICGTTTFTTCSDDRLKTEETPITNATETLMKLKPQTYMKAQFMGTENPHTLPAGLDIETENHNVFEAGLIAQEVYYDVPELRFLVKSQQDMSEIQELPEGVKPEDIHDQEWNEYGWSPDYASSFSYTELIPYLIKMNQEQQAEINTLKQELASIKDILARNNIS